MIFKDMNGKWHISRLEQEFKYWRKYLVNLVQVNEKVWNEQYRKDECCVLGDCEKCICFRCSKLDTCKKYYWSTSINLPHTCQYCRLIKQLERSGGETPLLTEGQCEEFKPFKTISKESLDELHEDLSIAFDKFITSYFRGGEK